MVKNTENHAVVFDNPYYNQCYDFKPFHSYKIEQETMIERLGIAFIVATLKEICLVSSVPFNKLNLGTMFYDKKNRPYWF